jgi:hypothetical protein
MWTVPGLIFFRLPAGAGPFFSGTDDRNIKGKVKKGTMRPSIAIPVFCSILVLLVQGGLAFTVGSVAVSPPGELNPGDGVNVTFTVYAAAGTAFPAYDDLEFVTDLNDPSWTYAIAVNGVPNSRPVTGGRTLTISGFELGYRNQDEVIVQASLGGTVPAGAVTGANKTLVTIQELDSRGAVIPYSVTRVEHFIGRPTPVPTPSFGSLSAVSVPAGANVYLDNAYRGLTPVVLNGIPNGDHLLLLKLEGYQDLSKTVSIRGDAQMVNTTLSLKPSLSPTPTAITPTPSGNPGTTTRPVSPPTIGYGALSVTTSPPGALVYLDGVIKGVTPATIPQVTEGPHVIRLVMDGYQDLTTTITVNAGTTSEYITGLQKSRQTPGFVALTGILAVAALMVFRRR